MLDGEHVFASANEAGIAIVGRPRSEAACRLSALRVAVVGVGHLGRHHARILSTLEGAELVAVVDTDPGAGRGRGGDDRRAAR